MANNDITPWTLKPMVFTFIDKGVTREVTDIQPWIDERKTLLLRAREIMTKHDGSPGSLYPFHGEMIGIARKLARIKKIFDLYGHARIRHADENINALVAYFSDPATMEAIDD